MMFVLAAVAASQTGVSPAAFDAAFWAYSARCSSLLCLSSRTVKFLGELQISSNCVRTSLICLINSDVLGDCLNLTVLMKADLY